ncbi:PAS domain S-box protein [Zoogloea sp.]|uniref:PAS domain S-box protein n=1 Tax=Zoogloea sp. TaxID=49181 RepID=UPI00262CC21B|nr:PAS domain S-box protein [Zoogloea sp.]MDD3352725.1 PAS domain S-box protein [Zoogloea sp.]
MSSISLRSLCDRLPMGDEAAREACEVCYRAVFEAVSDPCLVVNRQGRIASANPAAGKLYGVDPATLPGQPLAEFIAEAPPAGRLFHERPETLVAAGFQRIDGRHFIGEASVAFIGANESELAILVVRDVTEVRETRSRVESLQASERLWQFALEGHGDALWDWNLESGEIHVSPSFQAIIGWPDERPLRGNDIWPARIHPDDLRRAMGAFAAHLSGARPITEVQCRLRLEDDSYRWVAVRGKIMERDEQGQARRMIGSVRDIHDNFLSAEQEKRQQRELERAARLIHLGEMASALAHELNQPLTALRNFSAVALRRLDELGADPAGLREPLQMIADQALRAGDIVHQVRGFVRKGGRVVTPVAINEVVRSVRRLMQFDARAHGVQCQLDLADALPPVLADQGQLEQVLGNLIKNGIDAMSLMPRARILRVSTRLNPEGQVEVAVADTGPGLAEAVRADPFAPFATTKPDGVGLGLAICRTIIENHAGRMWVEAGDCGGATFFFSLPPAP